MEMPDTEGREESIWHAERLAAYLDEVSQAIRDGEFWELPRELPLVAPSNEPLLVDQSKPANTARHFQALARQLLRMKAASVKRTTPGPGVLLTAFEGILP